MNKKILLAITCFILVHTLPVDAQNFGYGYSNYGNNYVNNDCTDYPAVTNIENTVIGKTFQNENIYMRVNRLEGALLGTVFPQEALCDRIDRLQKAAVNRNYRAYNTYQQPMGSAWPNTYNSYSNNGYYDNQNYGGSTSSSKLMNILQNYVFPFMSNMGGANYNSYDYYGNPYGQYSINRNQNVNFGTGVRILP